MIRDKKQIEALYNYVHPKVRGLKIGEVGYIPRTDEFSVDDVMQYLFAYADHKDKWWDLTNDPVTNLLTVKRVPLPPRHVHFPDENEVS